MNQAELLNYKLCVREDEAKGAMYTPADFDKVGGRPANFPFTDEEYAQQALPNKEWPWHAKDDGWCLGHRSQRR